MRAKGWAVFFGAVLPDTGLADDPRHAKVGAATLARINADEQAYQAAAFSLLRRASRAYCSFCSGVAYLKGRP